MSNRVSQMAQIRALVKLTAGSGANRVITANGLRTSSPHSRTEPSAPHLKELPIDDDHLAVEILKCP